MPGACPPRANAARHATAIAFLAPRRPQGRRAHDASSTVRAGVARKCSFARPPLTSLGQRRVLNDDPHAADARSDQSTPMPGRTDHHSVVADPETLALLAPEPERSPLTRARARRVAHAPPTPRGRRRRGGCREGCPARGCLESVPGTHEPVRPRRLFRSLEVGSAASRRGRGRGTSAPRWAVVIEIDTP